MNLCRWLARPCATSLTYTARLREPPSVAVIGAALIVMSCGECTSSSSQESSTPEPATCSSKGFMHFCKSLHLAASATSCGELHSFQPPGSQPAGPCKHDPHCTTILRGSDICRQRYPAQRAHALQGFETNSAETIDHMCCLPESAPSVVSRCTTAADCDALSHVNARSVPYGPGVTACTGPKAPRSQLRLSSPVHSQTCGFRTAHAYQLRGWKNEGLCR